MEFYQKILYLRVPHTARLQPSKSSTPTIVSNIFANSQTIFRFRFFSKKTKPIQSATIVPTLWIYCTEDKLQSCILRVVKGGVLSPFPRNMFFSNPSSNPRIPACVAQIEIPFPFFYCFFFMNPSPSAQNPISQPLKKANLSSHFTPSRPSEWNVHFTYANNLGVLDFLVCASID